MKEFDAEMRPHLREEEELIPAVREHFTHQDISGAIKRMSKNAPWWSFAFYLRQFPTEAGLVHSSLIVFVT